MRALLVGCAVAVVICAGQAMAVTIDGTISSGEWIGAATYNIGTNYALTPVSGTVSIIADTQYLYAVLDLTAYTTSTSHHGDNLGLGVQKGTGGYPSGNWVEFNEADSQPGNWPLSSGTIDGRAALWQINQVAQSSLPGDLQAITLWDTGHRVTELQIPLSALGGLSDGDTINVVGDVDFDSSQHWYPAAVPTTWDPLEYAHIALVPDPAAIRDGALPEAVGVSPNPCAGQVTIRYTLRVPATTSLEIFDASGAVVRRLSAGWQTEGGHQASWDGRDEAGNVLPSGVYLSRLTTSRGVTTEKIVVTR